MELVVVVGVGRALGVAVVRIREHGPCERCVCVGLVTVFLFCNKCGVEIGDNFVDIIIIAFV